MSKRIAIINNCNDCPYFDNEYYGYHEKCTKLDREIPRDKETWSIYPIPEDCPLEKTND